MATKKTKTPISVEALKHEEATRKNIPTAEYQAVLAKAEQAPVRVAMERRNKDAATTSTVWIRMVNGLSIRPIITRVPQPLHRIHGIPGSSWRDAIGISDATRSTCPQHFCRCLVAGVHG